MRRSDPHDRPVQVVEALVGHDGGELGAPAAKPRVLLDREQAAGLDHFAQDRSGIERDEAADVDHGGVDAVRGERVRGGQGARRHRSQRHDRAVASLAQHLRLTQALDVLAVGNLAFHAVERFLLEEDHRVRIADGRRQQALGVGRRRRRHHVEAGHGHRPVLQALRVLGTETGAAAVGGADHERDRHLPVGHVARLGDLVRDHVPAGREEVREHDLRNRPESGHGGAHGGPDDRLLRDGRVTDPIRAEALEQPDRGFEDAAGRAHVLADEVDHRVPLHLLRDPRRDRLAEAQFRHAAPPSLQTWRSISSTVEGAPLRASSVAASTFCWARLSISFTSTSPKPAASSRSR